MHGLYSCIYTTCQNTSVEMEIGEVEPLVEENKENEHFFCSPVQFDEQVEMRGYNRMTGDSPSFLVVCPW